MTDTEKARVVLVHERPDRLAIKWLPGVPLDQGMQDLEDMVLPMLAENSDD